MVKPNPRQYVARISQLPGVEVWFQRATGGSTLHTSCCCCLCCCCALLASWHGRISQLPAWSLVPARHGWVMAAVQATLLPPLLM